MSGQWIVLAACWLLLGFCFFWVRWYSRRAVRQIREAGERAVAEIRAAAVRPHRPEG